MIRPRLSALVRLNLTFVFSQVRERFADDPSFQAILLESERIRLYREFLLAVEEACSHKHAPRKKKKKKEKKRRMSRSRSRSHSVSYIWDRDVFSCITGAR